MPDPERTPRRSGRASRRPASRSVPSAPWRPDYLGAVQSGKAQIYLLGWTGDFGDPANFLERPLRHANDAVRLQQPSDVQHAHAGADSETNLAKRTALYQQANMLIMKFLPVVPYVHTSPALGVPEERERLRAEPGRRSSPFATVYFSGA